MYRGRGAEDGGRSEFRRPPPPYKLPSYGVWQPRGTSWLRLGLFHACPPMEPTGLPSASHRPPRRGAPGEPKGQQAGLPPRVEKHGLTEPLWRRSGGGWVGSEAVALPATDGGAAYRPGRERLGGGGGRGPPSLHPLLSVRHKKGRASTDGFTDLFQMAKPVSQEKGLQTSVYPRQRLRKLVVIWQ